MTDITCTVPYTQRMFFVNNDEQNCQPQNARSPDQIQTENHRITNRIPSPLGHPRAPNFVKKQELYYKNGERSDK